MQNNKIENLLKEYIDKGLSIEKYKELKLLIFQMDDRELSGYLENIWTEFPLTATRNQKSFDEVKTSLKHLNKNQLSIYQWMIRIAAILFLPIITLYSVYLYVDRNALLLSDRDKVQISTLKGDQTSITLPDGSIIFLNSESSIIYPTTFGRNNREITLSGEAFLNIAKDKKHPFIVNTKYLALEVLGTSFNVSAYPKDSIIETTLLEGKIKVTPQQKQATAIILVPNQKLRFNNNTFSMNVSQTDSYIETAWRRGDLIFKSEPLSKIIEKLERYYGMNITVTGKLPEQLFTGTFHEDQIIPVLQNLQLHYSFYYTVSGKNIYIQIF